MTQDRSARRLFELMDDIGRGDDTYVEDILRRTATMGQRRVWSLARRRFDLRSGGISSGRRRVLVLAGLVALLALVVGAALSGGFRQPDPRPLAVSNGWIAYSTMPGDQRVFETDRHVGGDIYLIREGVRVPVLVAARGPNSMRNVCPAFSPDGRLLAFGQSTGDVDRSIVVVQVRDDGGTSEVARVPVAGPGLAPCVMWSRDGARLAYIDGGELVVRGLDGSVRIPTSDDPRFADLERDLEGAEGDLVAPQGDLVAHDVTGRCGILVTRLDGSEPPQRELNICGYSIAAFSPDREWLIVLTDTSGLSFSLTALRIADGERIRYLEFIPINGSTSFPRRGDVSWQPVYR